MNFGNKYDHVDTEERMFMVFCNLSALRDHISTFTSGVIRSRVYIKQHSEWQLLPISKVEWKSQMVQKM